MSGLELEASGHFLDERLRYRFACTAQFDEEVIDLPDELAAFDVSYEVDSWMVGTGASYVGGAAYLAGNNPSTDSRITARVYGEIRLSENVTFHARVENLFDTEYEIFPDTYGSGSEIEGPGRAFYVGLTYPW